MSSFNFQNKSLKLKSLNCKKCDISFNYNFANEDKLLEHITQCYQEYIEKETSKTFCKYCQVFVKDIQKHYDTKKHFTMNENFKVIKYIDLEKQELCYLNPVNGIVTKLSNFYNSNFLIHQIITSLNKTNKICNDRHIFKIDPMTNKKVFSIELGHFNKDNLLLVDKENDSEKKYDYNIIERIFSKLQYEEIIEIKKILNYDKEQISKVVIIPKILNLEFPNLKEKYENIINYYKEFQLQTYSVENCELIYNWKQNLIFENNFRLQCITSHSINRKYLFHGFYKKENFENIIKNGYIESNNLDNNNNLLLGKGASTVEEFIIISYNKIINVFFFLRIDF